MKTGFGVGHDFSCTGGANHGVGCDPTGGGAECGSGECAPNVSTFATLGGTIAKGKTKLFRNIAAVCTDSDLAFLFINGNPRCGDPDGDGAFEVSELAHCIVEGAVGDIVSGLSGDAAGEVLARGMPNYVPTSPSHPTGICAVELGRTTQIGSEQPPDHTMQGPPSSAGALVVKEVLGCADFFCSTRGIGVVGNMVQAPHQTRAGPLPICMITRFGDVGDGAIELGQFDYTTGLHTSSMSLLQTVAFGQVCPLCGANGRCEGGPNEGLKCSNPRQTDMACPPEIMGVPPEVRLDLALTTESSTIMVPAHNPAGGVTNPAGAFCGKCDLDETIGCQNDSDCADQSICATGVGGGCCLFGVDTGAFGDDAATSASAKGVRSAYLPRLASLRCVGSAGDLLADDVYGLPGPARIVSQQFNQLGYPD